QLASIGAQPLGKLSARIETGENLGDAQNREADELLVEDPENLAALVKVGTLTNYGVSWPYLSYVLGQPKQDLLLKEGDILFTSSAHSRYHIARKVDVVRTIPDDLIGSVSFV